LVFQVALPIRRVDGGLAECPWEAKGSSPDEVLRKALKS
jgi:hypothetical protein